MTTSEAWLLNCGDSLSIVVADHEMVEYIQGPFCYSVPASPAYCDSVLLWQDKFVPVMDIAAVYDKPVGQTNSVICLLNYQLEPNTALLQLAIRVNKAPEKITVDDAQACELPDRIKNNPLSEIVLSSFALENTEAIIINITKLCSAEFRDLISAKPQTDQANSDPARASLGNY